MIGIGILNGFQKVAIMIKGYIKEKGMFTIAKKSTHKLTYKILPLVLNFFLFLNLIKIFFIEFNFPLIYMKGKNCHLVH